MWWVGRGINGGPAELYCRAARRFRVSHNRPLLCVSQFARWLYRKLIAVLMPGVFVDNELYAGASKLSPAPPSRFSGTTERLAKVLYSHAATQPQI